MKKEHYDEEIYTNNANNGTTRVIYDIDHEDDDIKKVRIMLSQHIGAPATAAVKVGDKVERGQVVGAAGNGLSVAIHASISGTVTEVSDRYVVIEK